MNRKLIALNLLLAATVILAGYQLRGRWAAAKAREAAKLHAPQPQAPPTVLPSIPKPSEVVPATYVEVAQKDLFEKDRNPNVIIEKAPEPPPPPPPVPPPLPTYYGMMNLGDKEGPLVIMSKAGSSRQEEVHRGEMIGDFKLVDFTRKEITLEWNGQTIHKATEEFGHQNNNGNAAAAAPPPSNAPPSPANPVQVAPVQQVPLGPGADRGATRACQPGDTMPPGTVQDGYVKVVRPGPFGSACFWEPSK